MILKTCDIWDMYDDGKTICITTNGSIKQNGAAVMGRGVAGQAKKRVWGLDIVLGKLLAKNGNVVQRIFPREQIFAFPVKPAWAVCRWDKSNIVEHMQAKYKPGWSVPGWASTASIELIEQSAHQLTLLRGLGHFDEIYLPRPGCGAGGLIWDLVEPIFEDFGDWLVIVDRT